MSDNESIPSREFSNKELLFSSWLVRNRELLIKIGYSVFVVLDVVLMAVLGFELWKFGSTYQATERALAESADQLIDWKTLRVVIAPDPLISDSIGVLPAGDFLDFIARVTNANDDRWVEFEYRFLWSGGGLSEWKSAFVLPKDSKYIFSLGEEGNTQLASLEIQNIRWHTITTEEREHLALTQDDLVILSSIFIPDLIESLSGDTPIRGAEFVVKNTTPFDLQDIPFNVIISGNGGIQAVNRVSLSRINQNEERTVRVRWFTFVLGGSVIVESDINYFDKTHFAPRIEENEAR